MEFLIVYVMLLVLFFFVAVGSFVFAANVVRKYKQTTERLLTLEAATKEVGSLEVVAQEDETVVHVEPGSLEMVESESKAAAGDLTDAASLEQERLRQRESELARRRFEEARRKADEQRARALRQQAQILENAHRILNDPFGNHGDIYTDMDKEFEEVSRLVQEAGDWAKSPSGTGVWQNTGPLTKRTAITKAILYHSTKKSED